MTSSDPRPVRLTYHALQRCSRRGTTPAEAIEALLRGTPEPAKSGRLLYRYNLPFNADWQGQHHRVKQVAPVVAEEPSERVVITVYTYYF